jgi:hypothetical protein
MAVSTRVNSPNDDPTLVEAVDLTATQAAT